MAKSFLVCTGLRSGKGADWVMYSIIARLRGCEVLREVDYVLQTPRITVRKGPTDEKRQASEMEQYRNLLAVEIFISSGTRFTLGKL